MTVFYARNKFRTFPLRFTLNELLLSCLVLFDHIKNSQWMLPTPGGFYYMHCRCELSVEPDVALPPPPQRGWPDRNEGQRAEWTRLPHSSIAAVMGNVVSRCWVTWLCFHQLSDSTTEPGCIFTSRAADSFYLVGLKSWMYVTPFWIISQGQSTVGSKVNHI